MMDKSKMISEIVSHYANGNKAKFAALLGVKPQTISAWETRGTFDAELIYAKCCDISADWLLSGDGPMIRSVESGAKPVSSAPVQVPFVNVEHIQAVNIGNMHELTERLDRLIDVVKSLKK